MSYTAIEVIKEYAFSCSAIEEIKFSPCLQIIEPFAFDKTFRLKEVDLSNTKLQGLNFNAFYKSAVNCIKMPKSLVFIFTAI